MVGVCISSLCALCSGGGQVDPDMPVLSLKAAASQKDQALMCACTLLGCSWQLSRPEEVMSVLPLSQVPCKAGGQFALHRSLLAPLPEHNSSFIPEHRLPLKQALAPKLKAVSV